MRRSLGCLSIPGIISALITLLFIGGAVYLKGGSLFSAGTLNAEPGEEILGGVASHHEIGGECKACHTAPWESESMADRCVVCHTEIRTELDTNSGLHGGFLQTQLSSAGFQFPAATGISLLSMAPQDQPLNCIDCHPEHRGPQAPLVEMQLADFPHDDLNFSLRSHQQKVDDQPFTCADCHNGEYAIPFDTANCVNCHYIMDAEFTQSHALQFSLDCTNCHDGLETIGSAFDHSLFPFQLTGSHTEAACADCHQNVHNLAGFQSAPQDCFSCHQQDDNHQGLFGTNCAVCHTPEGWKPAKIDHNFSKFPLEGKHINVDCEQCHAGQVFVGTPQDCFSCHKQVDPHQRQLGEKCETCHSVAGWDQVNINHSLFTFPLTGAHVNVACASCHQTFTYKDTPQDCKSCHQKDEPHEGRFGADCAACHTTDAWKPAKFDHNLAAFKLTGSHTTVACESCHQNGKYRGTPQDCYSCHRNDDKHNGQYGTSCVTCHNTSSWKDAVFDHNLSAFKLTGAHVIAACTSCHQNGVFKGAPQDCYSCHRGNDKHNGQFGTNCAACHTTSTWKGAAFDHNLSAFKLTGAHGSVACESCHQSGVFKGTPQDCYSCHRGKDKHNGQFGTSCASCHSTSTWKGATFNHNLSGFPLTGDHASLACTRCHSNGQYSGISSACVSCHAEPAYHVGMFGTNCAGCHNTSNWSATYTGPHPGIADEGGYGVNHGHTSCRTCHTSSFSSATCTACHDGNEGGDGGDD